MSGAGDAVAGPSSFDASLSGASQPLNRDGRAALESLCATYWRPLYVYLRRTGVNEQDAQDLTQAFFAHLLNKPVLQAADRQRGKFRTFLLASLKNFVSNQRRHDRAARRGGAVRTLSLDFGLAESRFDGLVNHRDQSPEWHYERSWAMDLVESVLAALRDEYAAKEESHRFAELAAHLGRGETTSYVQTAERLGITTNHVRVAVHRMRKRYRSLLEARILETVATPADVEAEIHHLLMVLG